MLFFFLVLVFFWKVQILSVAKKATKPAHVLPSSTAIVFWEKDTGVWKRGLCKPLACQSHFFSDAIHSSTFNFFSEVSLTVLNHLLLLTSPGLAFHSMLYPTLPDFIPFPGMPWAGFMYQWLRYKWENGQSFEGSSWSLRK